MTQANARDLTTLSGHCNGVRNKMKGATNEAKAKAKAKETETRMLQLERGKQPIILKIGKVKANARMTPETGMEHFH